MFVDVRLLGPLRVVDRSGQNIEIPGELPTALLAVLALEAPTPVSSARIVDALWGEQLPDSPEASLHSTVFQEKVMSEIGRTVEKFDPQLLSGRTWGDGLYLVFSEVGAAARCALDLQTTISQIDFEAAGLRGLRGLRLAAHAAPVFEGWDPIAGARLFFGAGVTQTARIEPRTPEGEVYVTHPFAALAALAGDLSIACQYVGTLPTAKGFGSLPLYALHEQV